MGLQSDLSPLTQGMIYIVSQDYTSPAYKLLNCQIRTTLPSADVSVKACNTQKRKSKVIHHKHVRQLPEIPDGSTVRICTDKDKS